MVIYDNHTYYEEQINIFLGSGFDDVDNIGQFDVIHFIELF